MFPFPVFSVETCILLALFFTLLLLYGTWTHDYFKKQGIPGPRPLPFLGTILESRKGFHRVDQECHRKYGNVWGYFEGRKPMLMVADPEMIKTVMVKECYSTFTNRRDQDAGLSGPMADAMTTVKDERWKRIRSAVSPSFTSGRLKQVFPLVERYSDRFIDQLKTRNPDESVAIKDLMGPYSLDVVTSASFSVDTDSINNPNDPVVTHLKNILTLRFWVLPLLLLTMAFPFTGRIFGMLGIKLFPIASVNFFYDILKKIKGERRSDQHSQVDFLQLMVKNQIADEEIEKDASQQPVKGMTDHEILSQSFLFIFGGYETTSNTLSYMLYHLAVNPDVMHTLQEEIDTAFPRDTPITYDAVMGLQYLDQVVLESMRITPTAPRLERACKKTVQIDGINFQEGCMVGFPVYALHHDPQYWTAPEVFRPERFSKDSGEYINPYVYMPFGLGPRNCIGMRFAVLVMKMVVVRLLQNFDLESCKETQLPLELDWLFRPTQPIKLKIVPRENIQDN